MNISLQSFDHKIKPLLKWCIWILAVGFYFYDFLTRVFPSVMIEAIMLAFNISAVEFGEVSGSYFYVYALMQFPVGLMMDRFGARRLLTVASLVCGLGVITFGLAPNVTTLLIARVSIALGSSFAFVGMLYITSHWFPKTKMSLLIGIGNSVGMLGGVFGEGPISESEGAFGWRTTTVGLGILGVILSILIFIVIHRAPSAAESKKRISGSFSEAWKNLKIVLSSGQAWINAFINLFLYATTSGFAALWGVFFLQNNYGLSRNLAGFANSMIYIGWMIGGPIVGQLATVFNNKRYLIQFCSLSAGILMFPILFSKSLPIALIFFLFILIGIFSAAQLLTFSHAIEIFSDKATGSASAFTNFVATLGGAIAQPFVGWMLDLLWTGGFQKGIKVFSRVDYQLSMLCFPLSFFAAFGLSFFLTEKKKPKKKLKHKVQINS